MRLRIYQTLVFLVILFLGGTGYGGTTVRFGILPVVDTLPLWVALEKGFFEKQEIDIRIVPFQSALERDAALQAGKLDGYFGDIVNTVLMVRSGLDLGIMTTAFHTHPKHRMFGIVSAPGSGIKRLSELQGKQVAISSATIIEYLLDRILLSKDLPFDFVEKLEIKKIPVRVQVLLADQVPAALLPEPLITLAQTKGAHVLADDRDLDLCLTVLALKRDIIKRDRSFVDRFLTAYDSAVRAINHDPDSFKGTMISRTRLPEIIRDRYKPPIFPEADLPSKKDVEAAQKWIIQSNREGRPIPYHRIVLTTTE